MFVGFILTEGETDNLGIGWTLWPTLAVNQIAIIVMCAFLYILEQLLSTTTLNYGHVMVLHIMAK